MIRQVNISPETQVKPFEAHDIQQYVNKSAPQPSTEYSCSPNGWMYRKDKQGVIPREIAKLFKQRKDKQRDMHTASRNIEAINRILLKRGIHV